MNTLLRVLVIALLAAVIVATGVAGGCSAGPGSQSIRGSGVIATESRDATGFTDVRLSGSGDVTIEQTGADSLSVEAEDNILPLLETRVRDGVLHLGTKRGVSIHTTRPFRYHITIRSLNGFGISGSGNVRATGIDAERLTADISGSGSATLSGRADDVTLAVSGSGDYDAARLASKSVRVTISGSGNATVNASDRLEASVSGSGSVRYSGNPRVSKHISGSGTVAPR